MKQVDPELIKRAVPIFLRGPTAFKEGEWEPILLQILNFVGFKTKRVSHVKGLSFDRVERTNFDPDIIGGCFVFTDRISFEVQAIFEDEDGKGYVDECASRWLNEIANRLEGMHFGHSFLKKVVSAAMSVTDQQFDEQKVYACCTNLIYQSCALEPIVLSDIGETFVQSEP